MADLLTTYGPVAAGLLLLWAALRSAQRQDAPEERAPGVTLARTLTRATRKGERRLQ
jgi:hypothetical protein